MKKKFLTVLIVLAASCALIGGVFSAQAEESTGTALLLPTSYEQYLALENPSDFAANDNYIAIVENSSIYLYNREDGEGYKVFTYTSNLSSPNFYEYEGKTYLYFTSDEGASNPIVYIDCDAENFSEQTAVATDIHSCSSFIINGNEVSFANASNSVYRAQMSGLDIINISDAVNESSSPASFTVYNGDIYYAKGRAIYTAEGTQTFYSTSYDISSFAIVDGGCYYTSIDHYFYRATNGSDDARLEDEATSAVKLCSDGNLYLLQGDSIRRYDPQNGFTDYEIGQYSDSTNRLGQGAADLSVNGGRLVIADTANQRVLRAERGTDGAYRYTAIGTSGFSPSLIAAGDDSFAVSSGRTLRLYSYQGELLAQIDSLDTNITGIAYSYGSYFVSALSQSVIYEIADSAVAQRIAFGHEATSLAADIFGDLYALSGTAVYKLDASENYAVQEQDFEAPAGSKKILSDYAGNLYASTDSSIYLLQSDGNTSAFSASTLNGLVTYNGSAAIVSFAFGFEEDEVYVLSDGFAAITYDLSVLSLDRLDATGVYDHICVRAPGADDVQTLRLVRVEGGAVTISLDIPALEADASVLPYDGYEKQAQERTGIVLAETENGLIVGFFQTADPESGVNPLYTYEVKLVLGGGQASGVTEIDGAQYLSSPAFAKAYTVEAVGLYKYPQMRLGTNGSYNNDFFRMQELPKSQAMTLIAKISHAFLDSDYYFVSVDTEGGTVYGYVPASFAVRYDADWGVTDTDYRYAHLDRGESVTLRHTATGAELTLSSREELKVYDGITDENGNVYVEYKGEDGTYAGYIPLGSLYRATPIVMVTLAVVMIATAAIIISICYLLLRKQPTLQ